MAKAWLAFTTKFPEFKNDINTMLIFTGLAYPYLKYRSDSSDVDFTAGLISYGYDPNIATAIVTQISRGIDKFPPSGDNAFPPVSGKTKVQGLWGDPIFDFMNPNPYLSPLFKKYGSKLSRGKDLTPPDCCYILEKSGLDVFDNCPDIR